MINVSHYLLPEDHCENFMLAGDNDLPQFNKIEPTETRRLCEVATAILQMDGEDLNPRPIGLEGMKVVDKVPIPDAKWAHDQSFFDCLQSIFTPSKDCVGPLGESMSHDQLKKRKGCHPPLSEDGQYNVTQYQRQKRRRRDQHRGDLSSMSLKSRRSLKLQIRGHQNEQWNERYRELEQFRRDYGHCVVPYHFKQNIPLVLWVKRQRHQYKLKAEGRHSTLTDDRERKLRRIGFVWDSHKAAWEEKLNELIAFRKKFLHCNVPANFAENPQLAIWVKCQRRQYKLYCDGQRSNITEDRIRKLTDLGFVWNPRGGK